VSILHGLANAPEGATVSDLAREVRLPIATTFRMLLALREHGFVDHDGDTKRYRLGMALVGLSHYVLDTTGIRLARAQLVALRDAWQESFFFCELVDGHVVCLDVVHPNKAHVTGLYIRPGRQMPLHSSASAKAILAFQPVDAVTDLLTRQPMTAFTPHTITSVAKYRRSLREVQLRGYALCDQETQLGIVAVSVPVRDRHERVAASLTVLGTAERIRREARGLVSDLLASAKAVKLEADFANAGVDTSQTVSLRANKM
jgi:DNA-binding IclR family transcriptional regulator